MRTQKVTISIAQPLYEFVETFQQEHQCKSRSDVISLALQLLQQKQLEAYYLASNKELDNDFDVMTGDGLDDEAW